MDRARTKRPVVILLGAALLAGCGSDVESGRPTVATVEVVRGSVTVEDDGAERPVRRRARATEGAIVSTGEADGRAGLGLDGGAWALLERGSQAELRARSIALRRGRVWVDASWAEETAVETDHGRVAGSGASFSVAERDGQTVVYCASGELSVRTDRGAGRVQQGEEVSLRAGTEPVAVPAALWEDWTGGLADPSASLTSRPAAVGTLAGRRLDEVGVARRPIPVRRHDVRVAIAGDLATTEVVQTFFNARSELLEAEYAIRLPPDALVTAFAVAHGAGEFVESSVCGYAATVEGEPSWNAMPTSPSALAWDGPDRLRARVFPVPPGGTVRVRIAYAEWTERTSSLRRYVYPMGGDGEPPLLGELSLEVDLSAAGARAVRAGLDARVDGQRVVLRRNDFRPRADFWLELVDDSDAREAEAVLAHVVAAPAGQEGGDERYVLVDVPTEGLAPDRDPGVGPVDLVLLVDVSGGTYPEDLEVARALVEATLRQLAPTDRVALLLADVTAHPPPGLSAELREASPANREAILEALARVGLGGATDLGRSLSDAVVLAAGRPRGAVVYIGDGVPTTGGLDASSIRASLAAVEAPPRLFAIGIGEGADAELLGALFGRGAFIVEDRIHASRAVMGILAEASQPTLRGVTVELGPNVERIYPSGAAVVPVGDRLRLTGRLRGDPPASVVVRGFLAGEAFERTLPVASARLEGSSADSVRQRWAAQRFDELRDADASPEVLTALAMRFHLVTPWTALVVGAGPGHRYSPVRGFDRPPLGGDDRRPGLAGAGTGSAPLPALETAWEPRVTAAPPRERAGADLALARLAAERALAEGGRGPELCFERRLLARPELGGEIEVRVDVDGAGVVRDARVVRSTLSDRTVESCILAEARGVPFPAMGATGTVSVTHRYAFVPPTRELGVQRSCSHAARETLPVRRSLWLERLAARPGVEGALATYREAEQKCELGSWAARRALLDMMLLHAGSLDGRVQLYRAFGPGSTAAVYLKREMLMSARTPAVLTAIRAGLGLAPAVDWNVFAWQWHVAGTAEERLSLVRRWLEAVPEDMDLRLRLLELLEETGARGEARRLARALGDAPLADARARSLLGDFWLRQDEVAEARRALSGIVEHAPRDPWAHRRLGDLYLANGWGEDAYREYLTLARLRPDDPSVVLALARGAAAAGRVDEALRLEQRLSESVAPEATGGPGAFARLWTAVRLARLKLGAGDDAALRAAVARRERASGVLRDRPVLFAALTWDHPDVAPELHVRYPSAPAEAEWARVPLRDPSFGIEALRVRDHEPGEHRFEVRRGGSEATRQVRAELLVVTMPGTSDERIARVEVELLPDRAAARYRLTAAGELEPVAQ